MDARFWQLTRFIGAYRAGHSGFGVDDLEGGAAGSTGENITGHGTIDLQHRTTGVARQQTALIIVVGKDRALGLGEDRQRQLRPLG